MICITEKGKCDSMAENECDKYFMREALRLADEAAEYGEVPVGCVIVYGGEVIARGRNAREQEKNALCHAEIAAIDEACRVRGGWRLSGCTLYVTLEPCPMCSGAILNARVDRVVYGAKDSNMGALGSVLNMCSYPLGKRPDVTSGVLADECSGRLRSFFSSLRRGVDG